MVGVLVLAILLLAILLLAILVLAILVLAILLLAVRLITSYGWSASGTGGHYQRLLALGRGTFALIAVAVLLVALLGLLARATALHPVPCQNSFSGFDLAF